MKLNGKILGAKPAQSIAQQAVEAPAKVKKSRKRITNKGYPPEVYTRLFEYVAMGETLAAACKHQGLPSVLTVRRRMQADDKLFDQYRKAENIRVRATVEDLLTAGARALEGQQKVSTSDRLAAAKLDSDNAKWMAQRLLTEFAGDGEGGNVVLNITGAADIPPVAQPASMPAQLIAPLLKIVGGPKPDNSGSENA